MVQRNISVTDVREVLVNGEVIEVYPNDTPYPSRLILGWTNRRPIHVVAADNTDTGETIIITAYEPGADQWETGFRRRRRQ